jgi:hypothetical protein
VRFVATLAMLVARPQNAVGDNVVANHRLAEITGRATRLRHDNPKRFDLSVFACQLRA